MKKVMIGMSGGVDSSVAAYLLKEKGYDVVGVTLKLCGGNERDATDAETVANILKIPHSVCDMNERFDRDVIRSFIESYKNGETPNPCALCNQRIKFGAMLEYADECGMDYVATGHYARIEKNEKNRYILLKAKDETKDQSYFLYSLTPEKLARIKFPLGEMTKSQIRCVAEEQGLVTAHKRDSQDICFVPNGDYAEFIEKYSGESFVGGDFVDLEGNVLGRHNGVIRYTVGQRKGLGIALGRPAFVCSKDIEKNTVTLGENSDLFASSLVARDVNLISLDSISEPVRLSAKIRYNQKEQPATVVEIGGGKIRVDFDEPQRAIAKGQAVVLYDKDVVVGGGIIDQEIK